MGGIRREKDIKKERRRSFLQFGIVYFVVFEVKLFVFVRNRSKGAARVADGYDVWRNVFRYYAARADYRVLSDRNAG